MMAQQKLRFHALRPQLEAPDVSPAAREQYLTFGGTELSLAALRGEEDMVKVLLESGASDVPDCLGVTAVYQVGALTKSKGCSMYGIFTYKILGKNVPKI